MTSNFHVADNDIQLSVDLVCDTHVNVLV